MLVEFYRPTLVGFFILRMTTLILFPKKKNVSRILRKLFLSAG